MTVISSQRYLNYEIVDEKVNELTNDGVTTIIVPVVNSYMIDDDGNELFIMIDKHHTMAAAKVLEIEIKFEEVEDELSYYKDIENHNGEEILNAHRADSAYYYIDTETDVW